MAEPRGAKPRPQPKKAKSLLSPAPAPVAPAAEAGGTVVDAPYVPAHLSPAEVTVKAVLLGIVLSVVLAAANTYLGLKASLTVAAAIPAAVVSLAVLRLFRKHTILENNMVQTIASAGTAVASGMVFTIPALIILGAWSDVHYVEVTVIGVVGGALGVLFTVPLRRALIVEERLAFPEGVATAEVLKSGEGGGSGIGALLLGGAMGLGYKLLQSGLHLWTEGSLLVQKAGQAVLGIGTQLSGALLGVGYIIGARISAIIFTGSAFTWLLVMPILTSVMTSDQLAANIPDEAACNARVLSYSDPHAIANCVYKYQARYIGVGAMLVGGFYSLYKLRGPLWRAVTKGVGGTRGAGAQQKDAQTPRTEREISTRTTFSGILLLLLPMFLFYAYAAAPTGAGLDMAQWNYGVAAVMALVMLVTGFLFSAVGAYMAGIVGSSNTPISGVTILTLIVSALSLKLLGLDPGIGAEVTIFVAAVIAIAGSIASDNLQDLKAGYMLGATPRRQQTMIAIGAVLSALVLAPILNILVTGPAGAATLENGAAQANLMASISSGIFGTGADLPYPLIGIGIGIAFLLILMDQTVGRKRAAFRIPVMAAAVGMYLPIETTAPIFLGGLVAYGTARLFRKRTGQELPEGNNKGVLFASGLIAGEALLGILTAGLAGVPVACPTGSWLPVAQLDYGCAPDPVTGEPMGNAGQFLWVANGTLELPGLLLLGYVAFLMGYVVLRGRRASAPPPS